MVLKNNNLRKKSNSPKIYTRRSDPEITRSKKEVCGIFNRTKLNFSIKKTAGRDAIF